MTDTKDDLTTGNAPDRPGGWEFDQSVTDSFDDMLEKSIPGYETMRRFVTEATAWRLRQHTGRPGLVVDLGASRGSALAPIIDKVGAGGRYAAIEVSQPMLEVLRERFSGYIEPGIFRVLEHDLRNGYPTDLQATGAMVVISSLTLQFVPIEYRQQLLRGVADALLPGGIFILVEKVIGESRVLERLQNEVYWAEKEEHGYAKEAVDRKRLSLEGVLVPLTAKWNEQLLLANGFSAVDCVWAAGTFRGWLAVKS